MSLIQNPTSQAKKVGQKPDPLSNGNARIPGDQGFAPSWWPGVGVRPFKKNPRGGEGDGQAGN